MRPPKKISTFFLPFLAIFTLFHLKNWPFRKIFPSYIYKTPQVMFGLVNNHGKWCQMSWVIFHDWTFLVGMCAVQCVLSSIFTLYYLPSSPQSRGGSPLSPFLYSEHLGSPPPAHMGSLPYNLDPNKGPVGSYHHSYTGSLQCIRELQLNGWLWNTFKRWPVNAV